MGYYCRLIPNLLNNFINAGNSSAPIHTLQKILCIELVIRLKMVYLRILKLNRLHILGKFCLVIVPENQFPGLPVNSAFRRSIICFRFNSAISISRKNIFILYFQLSYLFFQPPNCNSYVWCLRIFFTLPHM